MYCSHCGKLINDDASYCSYCGQPVAHGTPKGDGQSYQVHNQAPQQQRPPQQKRSNPLLIAIAAVAVVLVLVVVIPSVFPGKSTSSLSGTQNSTALSRSTTSAIPKSESTKNTVTHDVMTADFSFDIPSYWKGKVDWKTWAENGRSHAVVYPKTALGYVEGYHLVLLDSVDPSAPDNAGDFISHRVASLKEAGKRVDVWSKNWPAHYAQFFYSNPYYGGSSQEHELMNALIDLSCGGLTIPPVRETAEKASSPEDATKPYSGLDVSYLSANLVPTIEIAG